MMKKEQSKNELKNMNYRDRITIESGKRSGKPCIRGMRITVYLIDDANEYKFLKVQY